MNRAQRAKIYRYVRYLSLVCFFSLFFIGLLFGIGTVCSIAFSGLSYSCPFSVFQQILDTRLVVLGLVTSALLIIIPTLVLGRFFCGWVCPLGALLAPIGGLVSKIRKKALLPGFLKNKDIKYGVLLGSVIGAVVLAYPVWCIFCPVGGISKIATPFATTSANVTLPGVFVNASVQNITPSQVPITYALPILGTGVILLAVALEVLETRAWCKYFCGLGAVFGLLSGVSNKIGWQIRMPMDRTIECKLCEKNCPMGIPILDQTRAKIKADSETDALAAKMGLTKDQLLVKARKEPIPELKKIDKKYSIQSTECIKCFTCVNVCPVYKTEKKEKISPTPTK